MKKLMFVLATMCICSCTVYKNSFNGSQYNRVESNMKASGASLNYNTKTLPNFKCDTIKNCKK